MKWLISAAVTTCLVGALSYFVVSGFTNCRSSAPQENVDFAKAQELLQAGDPYDAFDLIKEYLVPSPQNPVSDRRWLDLALTALVEMEDPIRLTVLYKNYPELFDDQEEACRILAWGYVFSKNPGRYAEVRMKWKGREKNPAAWFLLDVDDLLGRKEFDAAQRLLESKRFEGKEEVDRVTRLALIKSRVDANQAWQVLHEALQSHDDSASLHSRRAELAEMVENLPLAQLEFRAAHLVDPKNAMYRDQLAEFYRRHEDYKEALEVWAGGVKRPSVDILWLKAIFWSHVVAPLPTKLRAEDVPSGRYASLAKYFLNLAPGTYWDEKAFSQIEKGSWLLEKRQEAHWMKLIQLLKEGREKEALALLNLHGSRENSWNLELEIQLKRLLLYRQEGVLLLDEASRRPDDGDAHDFFEQLNDLASSPGVDMPQEMQVFLQGPDVFAGAFLAGHWPEAALQLRQSAVLPESYPDWVAVGLVQAVRMNRGPKEALVYALQQRETPPLKMLKGELLLDTGDSEAALAQFLEISQLYPEHSLRAAWLISSIYLARDDFESAKNTVKGHPDLASNVLGKEILARVAYRSGDEALADQLYGAIEKDSVEAKSYLARRAFERHDWKRAQQITQELVQRYPTHPQLLQNLQFILQKEAQEGGL